MAGRHTLRHRGHRAAFSLVELLVVVAIIAALVGLLVPAVQGAREAARRAACQNTIRQIGLAMHLHVDARGALPANGNYAWNGSGVTTVNAWSALARILPFVEEEALFKGIDFSRSYSVQVDIASRRVATFMCPSERNDRGYGTDPTHGHKYWPVSYGVNMGTWRVLAAKSTGMQAGDGAFTSNRGRKPGEIADGFTNTLALAEVKAFTNRLSGASPSATFTPALAPPADVGSLPLGAFNAASFTHVEWVDGKVHETGFTTVFPPNTSVPHASDGIEYDVDVVLATEANPGDTYAAITSRSHHVGGVNTLMMDASVRFVDATISTPVWRAMGTVAGGEVVDR